MEVTEIPPGIISSHKALLFGIPLDHASTAPAVRPCLEQARTCVADLEDLIKLCNENLPLLRTKPAIFQRTSNIIERARGEIAQVCQLLERMMVRPGSSESYNDRDGGGQGGAQIQISFKNRWGRLSTDARNLINHEQPLVAKEHGAVVGELNFVRQLVLIAPTIVKGPGAGLDHHGGGERRAKTTVWDNMGLLDEIIGGGGGNRNPSRTTEQQQRQQTYVNSRLKTTSAPASAAPLHFIVVVVVKCSSTLDQRLEYNSVESYY
ncbi:hypothetical protein B0H65DRAFT_544294 [Neurospora tetraspora]|uniref:Uncharacterized protein n=1 Tax=Neurospora tetraspora TaxID=94610 RepID=A0AAE0JQ66_9PEZI|nr:hypothetical protein B0H65DRAFT_544294 [Neurospora tetraspora]